MKYLIIILTLVSAGLIVTGFTIESENSQKLIGSGVALLFLVVFPIFSYYRWKDRDVKEYMLTKENLDKMRESQKEKKH
ncbi:hypothetical protein [Hyunsoonleella pacifica]|uniref:Isoleucyl-tRNA synthetase n=1 Tax=Hyunsoonleella pacifica TaxID=1080224 RepID=A0A4Q9FLF9_9FLAO|nr:hypothetical protein [Hyunsoonleella pacifica]TBN14621.1 hypothetical protein EYD46_13705 [Hyunsoonleella pacifica]GGD15332.1 hypothetical protein GCM10011368_16570 [Hyunsoonleella pacifica]